MNISLQFSGFAQQALGVQPKAAGTNAVIDPDKVLYNMDEFKFVTAGDLENTLREVDSVKKTDMLKKTVLQVLDIPDVDNFQKRYQALKKLGWYWTYTNKELVLAIWDKEKATEINLDEVLEKVRAQHPELKFEIWLEDIEVKNASLRKSQSKSAGKADSILPSNAAVLKAQMEEEQRRRQHDREKEKQKHQSQTQVEKNALLKWFKQIKQSRKKA